MIYAVLYAACVMQLAVFAGASAVLARAVGAKIVKIELGLPGFLRVRRAEPEIRWGPAPAGSVALLGMPDDVDSPHAWLGLALPRRLLVVAGPWLAVLAIACACLGPAHALSSVAHGFAQLAYRDFTPLVRRFLAVAPDASVAWLVGVTFAKSVAFNLLPIGGLAGSGILRELVTRARKVPRAMTYYIMVTMLVFQLWFLGRLAWAVFQLLRG